MQGDGVSSLRVAREPAVRGHIFVSKESAELARLFGVVVCSRLSKNLANLGRQRCDAYQESVGDEMRIRG